jgi:hypothetical protein
LLKVHHKQKIRAHAMRPQQLPRPMMFDIQPFHLHQLARERIGLLPYQSTYTR